MGSHAPAERGPGGGKGGARGGERELQRFFDLSLEVAEFETGRERHELEQSKLYLEKRRRREEVRGEAERWLGGAVDFEELYRLLLADG